MERDTRLSKMFHYRFSKMDATRAALKDYLDYPKMHVRDIAAKHNICYKRFTRAIEAYVELPYRRRKPHGRRNKVSPTS